MRKKLETQECINILQAVREPIKQLASENSTVNFLYEHAFSITLNANDTFGWACADSVSIAIEDLPKLFEVEKLYGSDGVTAFMSLVADCNVIDPLNTEKYKQAKEYLKDYKPASWVL